MQCNIHIFCISTVHSHHFNCHFPCKPESASCPLQFPVILMYINCHQTGFKAEVFRGFRSFDAVDWATGRISISMTNQIFQTKFGIVGDKFF